MGQTISNNGIYLPGLTINEDGVKMPGLTVDHNGVKMPGLTVSHDGVKMPGLIVGHDATTNNDNHEKSVDVRDFYVSFLNKCRHTNAGNNVIIVRPDFNVDMDECW